MPFLVDSVTMELSAQQRNIHVIVHPQFEVTRDITGSLQSVRAADEGSTAHRRRHPARVVDAHRDRPDPRGRGRRRDRVRAAERAARRPRGRRGLAAHARAGAGDRRRAGHRAAAAAGRGDRAGPGAAAVAGRRPLHVPRLPRVPPRARGRRRGAPRDPRHRLRHPARRPGHVGLVRQAPGPGQGQGPREEAAGAGQGQLPRHRAPPGVPRLRRREDLRRRRRRGRRAPVPRAVLQRRLHRVRQPDPDGAREGRRGAGPGRLRHPQPRRQGADGHPRELPARRAVPDPGRGAGADRRGRDVHPRAPPAAAVRAPRHLRPVPLLPGLPPARPLQHHGPRADLRDPQAPARRRVRGVHRPGQRVQHGPAALRGAPAEGRADGRGRRRRPRAPPRRRGPLLVRRLHRRGDLGVRRGGRLAPGPDVRRVVPRGLQGGLLGAHRLGRPRPPRGDPGRRRHRPVDVRADGRRPRRGPAQGLPDRLAAVAEPGAADAQLDGRRGRRRAAVPARGPAATVVHLRVRAALRPVAAGRGARALPGRAARGVGRPQRDRRVQRAGARRRADLAAGDRAARLREVHAPGRHAVRAGLHRGRAPDQRRHHPAAGAAVRVAVRARARPPGGGRRGAGGEGRRDRGPAGPRPRRRGQPRPRPDPAVLPDAHPRDAAHQLLPERRGRPVEVLHLLQAGAVGDPGAPGAAAEVRDLRLLPAGRGRAPALRSGGPRRAALVGPTRRLPHRGARPGQGADGQEHRDRAGRLEGRLLRQEPARLLRPRRVDGRGRRLLQDVHLRAARHHRQPRRRRDGAAGRGGPPRRRRLLPRGRGRQGHRDVLRHRQRGRAGLRLLARRRVRLRWLGGLRPQGDGHHRPRRLGLGPAALPRDGRRHPDRGPHLRRHRRHVRRRLRQRPALLRAHPSGGGVRPPRHLHRPDPGRRGVVRRAPAAVRAAALVVAGLRQVA